MRELHELVDVEDSALPLLQSWIAAATNEVEWLSCDASAGAAALTALQVTTRSPMGALAHASGGLLVDGGWLRILGAGSRRLARSLPQWNMLEQGTPKRLPGALLVGDDAAGGFFAVNGGNLPGRPGLVQYFAPDSLTWECLDVGYSDWLSWVFTGDLATFYANVRWPTWHADAAALAGDQAYSFYPPLFTAGDIGTRDRRAVPIAELWDLYGARDTD